MSRLHNVQAEKLVSNIVKQIQHRCNNEVDFINEHRTQLKEQLNPIINQVTISKTINTDQIEKAYRPLICAILLTQNIGSPTNSHSVSATEIPNQLMEGVEATKRTIVSEMRRAKQLAYLYTSCFLKLIGDTELDEPLSTDTARLIANDIGINDYNLKAAIINAFQYKAYLEEILSDLGHVSNRLAQLATSLKAKLRQTDLVDQMTLSTSDAIYPSIVGLSQLWKAFQEEQFWMSMLTSKLEGLQAYFVGRRLKWQEDKLRRLAFTPPHRTLFFEKEGFCTWSFVHHQGLLIPADVSIGLLQLPKFPYLYAFSNLDVALEFACSAEQYLASVQDTVRRFPELIHLLNLSQSFERGIPKATDGHFVEKVATSNDAGMQTEVHPVESYIDKDYDWNEWEMRKKALLLANMRKKATNSIQTILSNWRCDKATQVYLPKSKWTNTKTDGYSQVPKPSVFIHGLRGSAPIDQANGAKEACSLNSPGAGWCKVKRKTVGVVVDLTIPVEQQVMGSKNKGTICLDSIYDMTPLERAAANRRRAKEEGTQASLF